MRVRITKGAVILIAEKYSKQGDLPTEILTQMEKYMLNALRGRIFKARYKCHLPTAKKGTKKGTMAITLVEIREIDFSFLDELEQIEE